MNEQRLLERFLRYVQIDTTACEGATEYPSSPGQWDLGRLLVGELQAIGLTDVEHDAHGLVWAAIPERAAKAVPVIALNAHGDVVPPGLGWRHDPYGAEIEDGPARA